MTKQEYLQIQIQLYQVELEIIQEAIRLRSHIADTELMVLAGKIAALDFMAKN